MNARVEFSNQLLALLPKLRRFARTLTGSIDEGDDLVQSACEHAFESADQFGPGTRFDGWMYRIVQTMWIGRSRGPGHREAGVDPVAFAEYSDDDSVNSTEDKIVLRQARRTIAKLPPDLREVLALISIEGLPYQAAAEILGIPIGAVMSRLSRARLTFYGMMAEPEAQLTTPFGNKR